MGAAPLRSFGDLSLDRGDLHAVHHATEVKRLRHRASDRGVVPGDRRHRAEDRAAGLYLAMGWSGMMLYDAVIEKLPTLTLGFTLAGGVLYTSGVIFHAWQRLRFQNAIWHGFVLLGAACHYTAILDMVVLT